jgi:serine phosphatase RsbU (regulator of sigma subunit)
MAGSTFPPPNPPAANICHAIEKRSACDAKFRGGDLFEVVAGPRYSTLLLADVSSKGALSLVHSKIISRRFRRAALNERSPARILEMLNGVVLDRKTNPDGVTFASAIVATFDRKSPVLTYSSAGHDIGLIIRGNEHQHLVPSGPVLGVIPAAAYFRLLRAIRWGCHTHRRHRRLYRVPRTVPKPGSIRHNRDCDSGYV